jgi:putative spermidine/putrescine transport system substrate-binding protein
MSQLSAKRRRHQYQLAAVFAAIVGLAALTPAALAEGEGETVSPAEKSAAKTGEAPIVRPADASGQPDGKASSEAIGSVNVEAKTSEEAKEEPETERATSTEAQTLRIATWSGAYGEAQREMVIERFKATRSIDVDIIVRNDEAPMELGKVSDKSVLDAAELSGAEIEAGCSAGQLEKLEETHSALSSEDAPGDFLPGSLKPCGVGVFAWSHVIVFNSETIGERKPKNLADVFDVQGIPGKRAFIKEPRFLMEAALMADGAEPGKIYELLGTEEGQNRALKKLEALGGEVLWVDDSKAAMKAVTDGRAVIAQTFSGRAFFSAARGAPIEFVWDGQIYSMTYWAIPAGSQSKKLAHDFLKFASQPQQLAAVAERFPYGPTRTSALALVKQHSLAGISLDPFLPTSPENLRSALAFDETWWTDHQNTIEAKFTSWLAAPRSAEPAASQEAQ